MILHLQPYDVVSNRTPMASNLNVGNAWFSYDANER